MLDGPTYRLGQALARQTLPNWHLSQIHDVPFDNEHFARNPESNRELVPIFDTLHESRFDSFIAEWGGLTAPELDCLVTAFTDCVLFQAAAFPGIRPRLPLSTLAAYFSIYRKIFAYAPGTRRILEIGPGSGFLSLFLKQGPAIEHYAQIEACQGFYLLQAMLNDFAFPYSVDERAFPQEPERALNYFTADVLNCEPPCYVDLPRRPARCSHYPWWRLGELLDQGASFDLVTANANLREFSAGALHDYLSLIKRVMTPDGVVFAQCLGGELARDHDALAAKLMEMRLAPIVYTLTGGTLDVSGPGFPAVTKFFALGHAVLIGEGHPLFEKYYRPEYYGGQHLGDEPGVLRMFFPQGGPRRPVTKAGLLALVQERLASHPALGSGPAGFRPAPAGWADRPSGPAPLGIVSSDKYAHLVNPGYLVPRLREIVAPLRLKSARVVVYAAGAHTEMMERTTCLGEARIVGVVDASPARQGLRILGCEVTGPGSLRDLKPDAVIIASARYQDEIQEALAGLAAEGVDIIQIYELSAR